MGKEQEKTLWSILKKVWTYGQFLFLYHLCSVLCLHLRLEYSTLLKTPSSNNTSSESTNDSIFEEMRLLLSLQNLE